MEDHLRTHMHTTKRGEYRGFQLNKYSDWMWLFKNIYKKGFQIGVSCGCLMVEDWF
jgi:hypothetical protein